MKRGQNFALKFIFTGSTIHCRLKKPVVLDIVGLFKILSIYRLIEKESKMKHLFPFLGVSSSCTIVRWSDETWDILNNNYYYYSARACWI